MFISLNKLSIDSCIKSLQIMIKILAKMSWNTKSSIKDSRIVISLYLISSILARIYHALGVKCTKW
jgi:hypothetical protein